MLRLALILPHFIGVHLAKPIADITSTVTAACLMLYHFPRILSRRERELAALQGE